MGNNIKSRAAAALAPVAASLFAAAPAFAANTGTFETAVNQVTDTANGVLIAVGYAILTLIAAIALIIGAKAAIRYITSDGSQTDKRNAIIAGITLIAVIVLALFLPALIDGASGAADTGVNLGTVSKS